MSLHAINMALLSHPKNGIVVALKNLIFREYNYILFPILLIKIFIKSSLRETRNKKKRYNKISCLVKVSDF